MVARFGWRDVILLVFAGVIAYVIWAGGQTRLSAFQHADRSACVRIEALKLGFHDSLERALKTLDQYAYYRDHPAERAKAVAEINRQLRLYAPVRC